MAFVFQDEAIHDTDRILDSLGRGGKAFTPALWRWEVGNVLIVAERRRRITQAESQRHFTLLQALPIEVENNALREAWNATISLARRYQLTLYDAAYLEIAIRLGLPLGSLDTDLRKAAKSEGVKLLPERN